MEKETKITFETSWHDGDKRTYSTSHSGSDLKFEEFMEMIKNLASAMYSQDSVNEYWK